MSLRHLDSFCFIRRSEMTLTTTGIGYVDGFMEDLATADHLISTEDLCKKYGTDLNKGLQEDEVKLSRIRYGENVISCTNRNNLTLRFFEALFGGFQILLWVGASLCFIVHLTNLSSMDQGPKDFLYLGLTLVGVITVSGLFIFFQEYNSNRILASFQGQVPQYNSVVRNGDKVLLENVKIVVGDIVEINSGEKVPADMRIIESSGLKVDNSSLTGEFDAVSKCSDCTSQDPMETQNLVFFSSVVIEGSAKGIVIAVGQNTLLGEITSLSAGTDTSETPLSRETTYFVQILSTRAVFIGVVFFFISIFMGYSLIDASCFLVGIIVANVPEGLLASVTICLALSAKRMASRNCLVKHLQAVEALGSTSTICSDKTGTLTQNRMTVSHLWFNDEIVSCESSETLFPISNGTGKHIRGLNLLDKTGPPLSILLRTLLLSCNNEQYIVDEPNICSAYGNQPRTRLIIRHFPECDALDKAILKFVSKEFGNLDNILQHHKKVLDIPFNSSNRYHASIYKVGENPGLLPYYLLTVKGAPEELLDLCTTVVTEEYANVELDDVWMESITNAYTKLGNLGERVLGFCDYRLEANEFNEEMATIAESTRILQWTGFRFVGLVSLTDPPRSAVPNAIEKCRTAGIKVVMITGDHESTAKAVARVVGIISEGNETEEEMARRLNILESEVEKSRIKVAVINGSKLNEMSSDELDDILRKHEEIVFARTTPRQKLMIVEAFQRLGQIVAVTGDGINDAPALKKADVGIAMGITGTDVAKEAADMIILDDNFASIVTSIEEGRLIFDNLKKCSFYALTDNIAELIPFLTFVLLKIPLPLGTIAMLLIDLMTDIAPTISLAYESSENDIMKQKPRDSKTERLITNKLISYSYGQIGVIETCGGFLAYFVILAENGFWPLKLINIRQQWDSHTVSEVIDSYGQEWAYGSRKNLEYTCWSGFFVSIVIVQWANLIICKTRRVSIVQKGLRNSVLNFALLFETLLAAFLCYTPGMDVGFKMFPLKIQWWFTAVPFAILIVVYDECRRFIIRKYKDSWFYNEFYY